MLCNLCIELTSAIGYLSNDIGLTQMAKNRGFGEGEIAVEGWGVIKHFGMMQKICRAVTKNQRTYALLNTSGHKVVAKPICD